MKYLRQSETRYLATITPTYLQLKLPKDTSDYTIDLDSYFIVDTNYSKCRDYSMAAYTTTARTTLLTTGSLLLNGANPSLRDTTTGIANHNIKVSASASSLNAYLQFSTLGLGTNITTFDYDIEVAWCDQISSVSNQNQFEVIKPDGDYMVKVDIIKWFVDPSNVIPTDCDAWETHLAIDPISLLSETVAGVQIRDNWVDISRNTNQGSVTVIVVRKNTKSLRQVGRELKITTTAQLPGVAFSGLLSDGGNHVI